MIRQLTSSDTETILQFAYQHEEENMFTIGAFERTKNPFEHNFYYGFFQNEQLIGLAVFFGEWGNLNVHSENEEVIRELTDRVIEQGHKIIDLACFRKYGDVIMDQLEKHDMKANEVEDKSIYKLTKEAFVDFSKGEEEQAKDEDREELVLQERTAFGNENAEPVSENEKQRIFPEQEFVIRREGKIITKANLNGLSKHFFQIGGVGTLPEYRGQGLAKQVVSALCKAYLTEGKTGILFTSNDNHAAIKVYKALGFEPFDRYMIAHYE